MLLILTLVALVELLSVAAATLTIEEIGDASLFGRDGTIAVTVTVAVIVCAGAIVAWQKVAGAPRERRDRLKSRGQLNSRMEQYEEHASTSR